MTDQNTINWYYAHAMKTAGPLTEQEIIELIQSKKIKEKTMIWGGSGEWHPAGESIFSPHFIKEEEIPEASSGEDANTPPMLPSSAISDLAVFVYFAIWFIFSILDFTVFSEIRIPIIVYLLPVFVLSYDCSLIKRTGRKLSSLWAYLLTPVYLYQRARCIGRGIVYFWISTAFTVVLVLGSLLFSIDPVKETAKQVVNQIIQENNTQSEVTCTDITMQKKLSDTVHLAVATLSDGTEWQITIREDKDQVWVTVVE